MGHLPEGYAQIEQPEPCDSAAHPTGRDRPLHAEEARLVRRIDQEVVVAPVAQPERGQEREDVNPRQEREHEPYFEAQDNVEDNAQPG